MKKLEKHHTNKQTNKQNRIPLKTKQKNRIPFFTNPLACLRSFFDREEEKKTLPPPKLFSFLPFTFPPPIFILQCYARARPFSLFLSREGEGGALLPFQEKQKRAFASPIFFIPGYLFFSLFSKKKKTKPKETTPKNNTSDNNNNNTNSDALAFSEFFTASFCTCEIERSKNVRGRSELILINWRKFFFFCIFLFFSSFSLFLSLSLNFSFQLLFSSLPLFSPRVTPRRSPAASTPARPLLRRCSPRGRQPSRSGRRATTSTLPGRAPRASEKKRKKKKRKLLMPLLPPLPRLPLPPRLARSPPAEPPTQPPGAPWSLRGSSRPPPSPGRCF